MNRGKAFSELLVHRYSSEFHIEMRQSPIIGRIRISHLADI